MEIGFTLFVVNIFAKLEYKTKAFLKLYFGRCKTSGDVSRNFMS